MVAKILEGGILKTTALILMIIFFVVIHFCSSMAYTGIIKF